jgi:hypothetical protein
MPVTLGEYRAIEVVMAITDEARLLAEQEIEFALVAIPSGPLGHAIDAYRQAVAVRIGKNSAHYGELHCLLASSRHARASSLSRYQRVLDSEVSKPRPERQRRSAIGIELVTNREWHGLEIESSSLLSLSERFSIRASTASHGEWRPCHEGLRVVLARGFDPIDHEALTELAYRIVDPTLPAEWEVGLWLRRDDALVRISRERAG